MPQGANCEKPHWLCNAGVGTLETSGGGNETNDLPSEIWLVVGVFASTFEISSSQNASCVSPKQVSQSRNQSQRRRVEGLQSSGISGARRCAEQRACDQAGTTARRHPVASCQA